MIKLRRWTGIVFLSIGVLRLILGWFEIGVLESIMVKPLTGFTIIITIFLYCSWVVISAGVKLLMVFEKHIPFLNVLSIVLWIALAVVSLFFSPIAKSGKYTWYYSAVVLLLLYGWIIVDVIDLTILQEAIKDITKKRRPQQLEEEL